jgi:hypothetical protein
VLTSEPRGDAAVMSLGGGRRVEAAPDGFSSNAPRGLAQDRQEKGRKCLP